MLRLILVLIILQAAVSSLNAQPLLHGSDSGGLPAAGYHFFNIFREKNSLGSTSVSEQFFRFSYRQEEESLPFNLQISRGGFDAEMIRTGDIQSVRLNNSMSRVHFSAKIKKDVFSIEPSGMLGRSQRLSDMSLRIKVNISPKILLGGAFGMDFFNTRQSAEISAAVLDQSLDLPVVFSESGSKIFLTVPFPGSYSLNAAYTKTFPQKKEPHRGFYSFAGFESNSHHISITRNLFQSVFSVSWHSLTMSGNSESFHGIDNFSYISLPEFYLEQAEFTGKSRLSQNGMLNFSAGYISLSGKLSGNLQTWPFTSLLINTFGNRINFRAEGNIRILQSSLGYKTTISSVTISPRLSYYDITPRGHLETWQPTFLVFGVRDYRKSIPAISRAGVGLAELHLNFQISVIRFDVSGGQYFPVYIQKAAAPSNGLPGTGGGESGKTKSDGGRWFTLSTGLQL